MNDTHDDIDFATDGAKVGDSSASDEDTIALDLSETLHDEQIVTTFAVNKKTRLHV